MAPDAGLVLRRAHPVLAQDDGSRLSMRVGKMNHPPHRGVGFRYIAPDAGLVLRLAHPVLAQDDGSRLSIQGGNIKNPTLRGWGSLC